MSSNPAMSASRAPASDAAALWKLSITAADFPRFHRPYVGNGMMASRFEKLVIARWSDKPLHTLTRCIYDGGQQLYLPAWNHVDLHIGGVAYEPTAGTHALTQTLDLRTGEVSLEDDWEFAPGRRARVAIRMLVPRTHRLGSCLSLSISATDAPATVRFGLLGAHVANAYAMRFSSSGDAMHGDYHTTKQGRAVSQSLGWSVDGFLIDGTSRADHSIDTRATAARGGTITLYHAVGCFADGPDARGSCARTLESLRDSGETALREGNALAWRSLWARALAFEHQDRDAVRMVMAHQFYLLSSLGTEAHPLGALGLSEAGWSGSQLWDADLWMFRAILPLWPELAKPIVEYRRKHLEGARIHAREAGYQGAWFGWMTDDAGMNMTHPHYEQELHLNVWIALAAWEYYAATRDLGFVRETAWPLSSGIADFFASRVVTGSDGRYHLLGVIGPDEAVCEFGPGTCDDNFLTNVGVKRVMEIARRCADLVGETAPARWAEVADGMFLPAADAQGIIPEYAGYSGGGIKQADLILAYYPLGFASDKASMLRNFKHYRGKVMYYGPLMNSEIEACILMRLGDKQVGLDHLLKGMREYTRGPHFIPYECRDNDNSVMLTGIGGELQALIYGLHGAEIDDTAAVPRIGELPS